MKSLPKVVVALIGQVIALGGLALLVYLISFVVAPPYPVWGLVVAQGVLASALSGRLGLPPWWRWIQFLLPLGLYGALGLDLHPAWALAAFIILWLVFANASKERVPLYLTNATTRQALAELVRERQSVRFLDLGCGLGGNVVFMANLPNVVLARGVETAPLPYLVSKLNTLLRGGQVAAEDLWQTDLGDYDLVYAFLSPEPMSRLWQKLVKELKPGSVFVSNSFAVPDVEPSEVWELADRRATRLYIYRR